MLIRGDARHLPLRETCIDCVVTSPPYFGLRDYGTAGQIGTEASVDAYVDQLRVAFREVWRVLKPEGTCWVNLGDTLRDKRLLGVPWAVAFALQAEGWYIRSEIIWAKPNAQPENVTDRPTRAHETLFLLTKGPHYFYDAAAIAEPAEARIRADRFGGNKHGAATTKHSDGSIYTGLPTRNKRSVWTVNTQGVPDAHFATFPEALIEPCVLAGCPVDGLVLDPFFGSGTTGVVAIRHGRRWIGVDLAYQELARTRTRQAVATQWERDRQPELPWS